MLNLACGYRQRHRQIWSFSGPWIKTRVQIPQPAEIAEDMPRLESLSFTSETTTVAGDKHKHKTCVKYLAFQVVASTKFPKMDQGIYQTNLALVFCTLWHPYIGEIYSPGRKGLKFATAGRVLNER